MEKTIVLWFKVVCIVLLIVIIHRDALSKTKSAQNIDQWIQQLQSKDWRVREAAVGYLATLRPEEKTDQVKIALIHELENELKKVETNTIESCPGEDCGEGGEAGYFNSLLELVASMGDERAFPIYAKMGTPTFLVHFGDKGVDAILGKLDTIATCSESLASVHILAEVLEKKEQGYTPHGATRQSIKKAMLIALKKYKQPQENIEWFEKREKEYANVRIEIVKALGHLAETGEADVIPVIKSIAMNDPFPVVRDQAQGTLNKLGKK